MNQQQLEQQALQQFGLTDEDVSHLFTSTPLGQKVLNWLLSVHHEIATFDESNPDPNVAVYRSGRRAAIKTILDAMFRAENNNK